MEIDYERINKLKPKKQDKVNIIRITDSDLHTQLKILKEKHKFKSIEQLIKYLVEVIK